MAKKKNTEQNADDALFEELAEATDGNILGKMDSVKYFVDTGSLAINFICSGRFISGGVPGGKITEIYGASSSGKSLLAANILYGCQKLNGFPIILDCENATNGEFMAKTSHLNLNRVIRYTPTTLEQAFLKMLNAARKIREKVSVEVPIVFIYDSISVSPCERELKETKLPENYKPSDWKKLVGRQEQPGERAKVCSKELRKFQALMEEMNITLVVLNQTREKIGVMYGCFHYDSRVLLADGSTMKIGKIVNQNMVGLEVLSFNPISGKIEPKKIVECHDNGNLGEGENFLHFKVRKYGGNGLTQFSCTPNHKIFVPKYPYNQNSFLFEDETELFREVQASELSVGDRIMVSQPYYLNEDQKQVVYGSILGNGSIRYAGDGTAQLRVDHNIKESEYCRWKEEILQPWVGYSFDDPKNSRLGFDTIPMHELKELEKYKEEYKVPDEVINNLGPLGLAIWYMDDGAYRPAEKCGNGQATIYCTKFHNRDLLQAMLKDRFGIECRLVVKGFHFDTENTKRLHEIIAPIVHPSMDYKLQNKFRGNFSYGISEPEGAFRYEAIESEILEIYDKPPTKSKKKFDITVEGNHSYIIDGAIVHNSPETTAGGGNALPFYASCRLRTATRKKIENKRLETFAGVNMHVKNVKNRSFRPFVESEGIKLYFDTGVNPISGLLSCLINSDRVKPGTGGNYEVTPEYLPENTPSYKFKAARANNDVPLQVLYDCPKLIDASSTEEVKEYLKPFMDSITNSENNDFEEMAVSFDVDGNPVESDFEEQ
jgi:recombination protein RecA